MKKILVVVDMQTAFIRQCGAGRIIDNVIEKIEIRKQEGYEIIFTVDKSGGELDGRISESCKADRVYKKHSYGCKELILDLYKSKPEIVEFAGVCTDICVLTNALGTMAFLPFAEIVVDGKCCASEDKKSHTAALSVMRSCKITVV